MKQIKSRAQVFDTAAYYRIAFYGELLGDWAELVEGMEAEVISSSDGSCTTVLSGWLLDQAALVGVVNTAYNLGIPLLCLRRLDLCSTG